MILHIKARYWQFLILIGGLCISFLSEIKAQNDSLNQAKIESYKMQIQAYQTKGDIDAAAKTNMELIDFLEEVKIWEQFATTKVRFLYYRKGKEISFIAKEVEAKLHENAKGDDLSFSLGRLYEQLGVICYYKQEYKLAERYLLEGYEHMRSMKVPRYENLEMIVHSLSNIYAWSFGRVKDGVHYAKLSLKYAEKAHGLTHARTIHATGNLAIMYSLLGAKNEAMDYYRRGFTLIDKTEKTEELSVLKSIYLANMGRLLEEKNKLEDALEYYEDALELQLEIGRLGEASFAHKSIGSLYFKKGQILKAEKAFLKSLEYIDQFSDPLQVNSHKAGLYYTLGELEIEKKDTALAKEHFNKGLSFLYANYPNKRMGAIANMYVAMAESWMSLDLNQSIVWLEQAMVSCSPTLELKDINPNISNAIKEHKFFSKQELCSALSTYHNALFLRYQKDRNSVDLELAYKIAETLIYLSDEVQNNLSNTDDQLAWLDSFHEIYQKSIRIAYELYQLKGEQRYLDFAFELTERNKSMLLLQTIQQGQALKFGGVPDSLIHEEQWLQTQLATLTKQRFDAIAQQEEAIEKQLDEAIFQMKETIKLFRETLAKNYPKYHDLRYKKDLVSIQTLQKTVLNEGQGLLEYFVTDKEIYIFYIDQQNVKLYKQEIEGTLKAHVDRFRKGISDFDLLQTSPQTSYEYYTQEAHWFFQNLLEPILKEQKAEQLIIIPDGLLGHLPFDAFLQKEASIDIQYKNLDYLLNNYTINYAYSSTLLQRNLLQKLTPKKQQILAFAASYPKGTGMPNMANDELNEKLRILRPMLKDLTATQKEVKTLEELFEGSFWYKKEANEQNFKQTASDYAVIHLAMHGILDKQLPMASSLAFSEDGDTLEDDFLHIYELSQMDLNAQLVVLSACETGYGKFEQGKVL
ncbi:MAG: CHAT domain-containing protein [Aureispira sp.]|nr:CHAT domain-containing protein [Aureispira sp.]